jgi:hypothetical protein
VTGLPEVVQGVSSFLNGILMRGTRPTLTWTMTQNETGGSTTVVCSETPTKVLRLL